jgi:hypothetical protein
MSAMLDDELLALVARLVGVHIPSRAEGAAASVSRCESSVERPFKLAYSFDPATLSS